jgi:DUF4097 and DUF4098 domain-containing protein YvlB
MRKETFATPRPLLVTASLPRGDLRIETADVQESTVTLSGSTERAQHQIERAEIRLADRGDRDELVVDVDTEDFGFRRGRVSLSISLDRHDSIDVRITVPHGTSVVATTASADIRAQGRFAELEAKAASGDIAVDDVERDATLKTASGDIRIDRVGGSLKAQSAAGDLKVGPVGGNAEVKTAAGDVDIDEVGASVTVHSASGDVRVGAVREGSAELKSVSGDMLVGIRRGSRVWMDVKTVTGDARSELDVADVADDGEGPLVELRATAMSGDIKIVRAG